MDALLDSYTSKVGTSVTNVCLIVGDCCWYHIEMLHYTNITSLAGKSPAVTRRHRAPPSPTPIGHKFIATQKELAVAAASQRGFAMAQKDPSTVTATNSPSSHSSSSTVRENTAAVRVIARHGDTSPPSEVGAARPSITPRSADRLRPHSPPSLASVTTVTSRPLHIPPAAVQQKVCESSVATGIPEEVPSPPLIVDKICAQHPAAGSSNVRVPSPPPSRNKESASRRSSRQHMTNSLHRESRHAHLTNESRGLSFSTPSKRVEQAPPEPPVDYDNYPVGSSRGSSAAPSPPVDPYPARSTIEREREPPPAYRHERVYSSNYGSSAERRIPPVVTNSEQPTFAVYSQKGSRETTEPKPSSASRIVQRNSFYDNVPPPTPTHSYDADDEVSATYGKRCIGDARRALGELIYESRSEDRSMERRFRNQQNSPTLFESRRQQTVTESAVYSPQLAIVERFSTKPLCFVRGVKIMWETAVETRVIQLPNNITYVSVGDEDGDSVMRAPKQRFQSGYGSPGSRESSGFHVLQLNCPESNLMNLTVDACYRRRFCLCSDFVSRFEPMLSHFRSEGYSPYEESTRFREGVEERQVKQEGPFLSHFRDESSTGVARGRALPDPSSSAYYYPVDGRRYAPAVERRPAPSSHSHHFPFPAETRGKHSMV
ncbi:unnamed protein product [Toxocara canis]|uniref:Doublecortin domain-containing protein n=1 Tax=Toxocara canis TaxID=6265 RepID=A0A183UJL4_TOXCA|nr:unnamed protein product [Toxocara canis]